MESKMKNLEQNQEYYCSKIGVKVTFLYYDSGYVVVQDGDGMKYWVFEKDLEELKDMSADDILKREG